MKTVSLTARSISCKGNCQPQTTVIVATLLMLAACASNQTSVIQPTTIIRSSFEHMPESLRAAVTSTAIVGAPDSASTYIAGDYGRPTSSGLDEAIVGAITGAQLGAALADSPLVIFFPAQFIYRVAILLGAIGSGVPEAFRHHAQQLRDDLADDLSDEISAPLSNNVFARDLYTEVRLLTDIDSSVIERSSTLPIGVDTILFVSLNDLVIDVNEDEAVIETSINATLRQVSSGRELFKRTYWYSDRDTLENWTQHGNDLWKTYAGFARRYFATEIRADVFERLELRHSLTPVSQTSDGGSTTPVLEWQMTLLGEDLYGPWTAMIKTDEIVYDLEIYNERQLVYSAKQITQTNHKLTQALEECAVYWWSVKPTYRINNRSRSDSWMRYHKDNSYDAGHVGHSASTEAAYLEGFAQFQTMCPRT